MADVEDARFRSFNGLTMAEFSAQTGLFPTDFMPTAGGRVFVVSGPPIQVFQPSVYGAPAVAVDATCRMMVETTQTGASGVADDWQIVSISRSGGCANI
ncbi:hypothetical protein [Aquibium microcysteis]|uniref:hypothetical protein n=1 Tax=Aquibium microcysteis TaxID=675281 RepID=UPI00165D267F|nr:hypothetical protein [Aquibium microcysteis]